MADSIPGLTTGVADDKKDKAQSDDDSSENDTDEKVGPAAPISESHGRGEIKKPDSNKSNHNL